MTADKKIGEKELGHALAEAFRSDPAFVRWFMAKTKFAGLEPVYHGVRADNPWGTLRFSVRNELLNESREFCVESETDVLAAFDVNSGKRVALHIEIKIGALFATHQPEMYQARAWQWLGVPKFFGYGDFETVIVAPNDYFAKHERKCRKFDCFVSHEDIAAFIPMFAMQK